jgi:hypothetical protein
MRVRVLACNTVLKLQLNQPLPTPVRKQKRRLALGFDKQE